jgi:hypothetical protein
MGMSSMRNASARLAFESELVSLKYDDLFIKVGEYAGREQSGDAAADDNRSILART